MALNPRMIDWRGRRVWLVGMVLSMAVFLGASQVDAGDETLFLWVCALSGIGLASKAATPSTGPTPWRCPWMAG